MARLAIMILTIIFSSLFLLSLARNSIDLPLPIETSDESNTSLSLQNPDPNQSTDVEISDPIKQQVEEDEEDKQLNDLPLLDELPDGHVAMPDESDPGIMIGWDLKEELEEEPKKEKVMKKKTKRSDESDSDSDSDSDDEEEEEEEEEKETKKKKKKGGFLRWFWKLINRFD